MAFAPAVRRLGTALALASLPLPPQSCLGGFRVSIAAFGSKNWQAQCAEIGGGE